YWAGLRSLDTGDIIDSNVSDGPRRLRVGVAGLPDRPGDVPVPQPLGARQRRSHGMDNLDDVPALAVIVEPLGVAGAHVQTAVAGIGVTLGTDRPGRGVHEDAAVG